MSPLWRDRLIVGLAPERLAVLRVGPRLRPGVGERHVQSLPAASAGQWDAPLAALEILLDEPAWHARDLTVVLSSHYARYAAIPEARGLTLKEKNDFAHLIFHNLFGDMSHDWELRVSPAGDLPTLASGVPHAFLKALRDACEGRGRLRSIQPGLMTVFNRVRPDIESQAGTLALVETGRVSLATIENGSWQAIASRACAGNGLDRLLDDECELRGRRPGGVLWLCDLTGVARLAPDSPWRLQRLKPPGCTVNGVKSLADWGVE